MCSAELERITYMGDLRSTGADQHSDDIEASRFVEQVMPAQIIKSRDRNLVLFSPIHRFQRVAILSRLSSFDLDKDDGVTIETDNINFTAFLPIISADYFEAFVFKK